MIRGMLEITSPILTGSTGRRPGQLTTNTEIHAYVTIIQQFKYTALRLKRIVPERCFDVHEASSVPVSISTWCTVNGKFRIKGNDPKKKKKKKYARVLYTGAYLAPFNDEVNYRRARERNEK